jgi:hypothetical protein
VALSPQVVRLRPAPHCRTPILRYSLRVEPAEHFDQLAAGSVRNYLARLVFPRDDRVQGHGDLVAEMSVLNPFDFFLEPEAETFPFDLRARARARPSRRTSSRPGDARFAEYVASIARAGAHDRLPGAR